MKKMIGVAGLLALLAVSAYVPSAHAQACGAGLLLKFDADCWAYETNDSLDTGTSAGPSTAGAFISFPGSQLSVVGIATLFCSPLASYVPDSNNEYTMFWTGLTSAGTITTPFAATGKKWDTDYSGGTFQIWHGSPPNAPTQLNIASNPYGGVSVPAFFTDGTKVLEGTMPSLHTTVMRSSNSNSAIFGGNFNGIYQFTGGADYALVNGLGQGTLTGNWCGKVGGGSSCAPANYSAHPNGKFDVPVTAVHESTWGAIKSLYR
jgi:hypothetical protein